MNSTDKNIKKLFSSYDKKYETDLEESIMAKINEERNYSSALSQSRKRMKIGAKWSIGFLLTYYGLTYFDTLPNLDEQMSILDFFLPSIFAGLLVFIMYLLSAPGIAKSK